MPRRRLKLELEPILPTREPSRSPNRRTDYGFHLRIPSGPLVEHDDFLLGAVGAEVVTIEREPSYETGFQSESVDPGRVLVPSLEPPDDEGDPVVFVWDVGGAACAGLLHWRTAGRVATALEYEIEVQLLALSESRAATDDMRATLEVLLFDPRTLYVRRPTGMKLQRPERAQRHRVVLFADEHGEVRWWEASAEAGPAEIGELPVSPKLRADLASLGAALCELRAPSRGESSRFEESLERSALTQEAMRLWRQARQELGRSYVVGFLGPGMDAPAWSPVELGGQDPDEDEMDF